MKRISKSKREVNRIERFVLEQNANRVEQKRSAHGPAQFGAADNYRC